MSHVHVSPLYSISAAELDPFVLKKIEPDRAYIQRCNAVVDRLCKFMQNSFPAELRPSEVIKSGSLGKGTAVKGKSDADLVVFLANFRSIPDLRRVMNRILDDMKSYLVNYRGLTPEETTMHAVKVSITCDDHSHSVDILPSVNILKLRKSVPLSETKKDIYREMKSLPDDEQDYYSAALAPLQVGFVARVPTKVKTLIRLIKYWRKTDFEESDGRKRLPSSYQLELISIAVWESAGEPENFNLCKGFYHVLRAIADYRNLKRAWTENYESHYCQSDPYYVVDPANPFNNVLSACNCWEMVAAKANLLLKARLFEGCRPRSRDWQ